MSFVLDASVALAWCFIDEWAPETQMMLDRLSEEAAFVPSHWYIEVANGLAIAERRRRIAGAETAVIVDMLSGLPIEVDASTGQRALTEILDLVRREGLTTYDAAYLDLAMREGLPLATRDSKLAAAARRASVEVLEG